jgi:soluble lytic murein transglycosylase
LASEAYDLLAKTYPAHSMADDAYTRGGVSLFETGEEKAAAIRWKAALDEHPGGDTTTESARRLALWYYDNNDPAAAIDVAKRVQSLSGEHPDDARAWGAYWYARWLMYPNVANPETRNADEGKWVQGREAMTAACARFPSSLYGSLAYARLMEVAPSVVEYCAQEASPPNHGGDDARTSATKNDAMRVVEVLFYVGLLHEARRLKARSAFALPSADLDLWWIRVMTRAGDTVQAHREARRFLKKYPIGTLGGLEAHAVTTAYPDWYFAQIGAAAKAYDYDPRLLHALAREESAFNVRVKSHAGAVGLTQVMPKTAEQTAGWLGITYTASKLSDPTYNATIGAKYLSHVYDDNGGNVALALAAYNAGPHRVDLWFKRFGNLPTDEFIERIPFKETRGYVRRVMGTWQILRWRSEEVPVYVDTFVYNHDIRPN